MSADPAVLIVGTHDTKSAELGHLADRVREQGGRAVSMDVGVLADGPLAADHSRHEVAAAGGGSIEAAVASGDENAAMQLMAAGASALAARLHAEGRIDAVLVIGGSMGTDLALDVCAALPLGVPKLVVSTIAFSPLIPPERIAPDVQMMLWAGGLYGLNPICRSVLDRAAGAVLGAARAARPREDRPVVGMTGLGSSVLSYCVELKPALEARGFEVAVFHATGMGGRAFEGLAAGGAFACAMDFCTQELGNHVHGSRVSAGPDRLTGAGRAGVPQIVAPGCCDLVDVIGWEPLDPKWRDHDVHAHNRLLSSVVLDADGRREVARAHARHLGEATGPSAFVLPLAGVGEWDREGGPLHRPEAHAAFCDEMRARCPEPVELVALDAHVNDPAFVEAVLGIFDRWTRDGTVETA